MGWRPCFNGPASTWGSARASVSRFSWPRSDAHGDFNYEATLDVVDFLGKPSRGLSGYAEDNALGKISTVVYPPRVWGRKRREYPAGAQIRAYVASMALLIAGFDRNSNGSLDDSGDVGIGDSLSISLTNLPPLQLAWVSSAEFGPLESIRLIVGSQESESQPREIPVPASKQMASGDFSLLTCGPS